MLLASRPMRRMTGFSSTQGICGPSDNALTLRPMPPATPRPESDAVTLRDAGGRITWTLSAQVRLFGLRELRASPTYKRVATGSQSWAERLRSVAKVREYRHVENGLSRQFTRDRGIWYNSPKAASTSRGVWSCTVPHVVQRASAVLTVTLTLQASRMVVCIAAGTQVRITWLLKRKAVICALSRVADGTSRVARRVAVTCCVSQHARRRIRRN